MGHEAKKTEHAGHKGSTRKSGYYGKRADAKRESNKARRRAARREEMEQIVDQRIVSAWRIARQSTAGRDLLRSIKTQDEAEMPPCVGGSL